MNTATTHRTWRCCNCGRADPRLDWISRATIDEERGIDEGCLIWDPSLAVREMARALVLQLLLAGVAAMPPHRTSEADEVIPSHLRGRADASDHATSHSRHLRLIDEEVADAHDQHALTPPDGDGVHRVHRSTRGQSLLAGTRDAAHARARRASARAAHGQTPRHHLQLERRKECDDVTITDANVQPWTDCTEINDLIVRARPRPSQPSLG